MRLSTTRNSLFMFILPLAGLTGCTHTPVLQWPEPIQPERSQNRPAVEQLRADTLQAPETRVTKGPEVPAQAARHHVSRVPGKQGEPAQYSINFDQMPLPGFIQYVLGDLLKLNLYVGPSVSNRREVITLRANQPVTKTELLAMAQSILQGFKLALIQDGSLYKVIPDNNRVSDMIPLSLRNQSQPGTPLDLQPIFQLVHLNSAKLADVYSTLSSILRRQIVIIQLRSTHSLLLYGQPAQVQSALDIIDTLDRPQLTGTRGLKVDLAYISPEAADKKLKEILTAEGYAVGSGTAGPGAINIITLAESGSVILLSANRTLLQHAIEWLRNLDTPAQRTGNQGLFVYRVQNANAATLARTVSQFYGAKAGGSGSATPPGGLTLSKLSGTVTTNPAIKTSQQGTGQANPASQDSSAPKVFGSNIVVNVATNSIIFRGSAQDFQELRSLLQELDQPERQVLIEVTVAEVQLGNTQQTGVEWALAQARLGDYLLNGGTLGGLGVPTSSGVNFTVLNNSGATRALIQALATSSKARILSTPRIMVLNGQKAFINVGDSVPVITTQQTASAIIGGTTGVLQSVQYVDTGVILDVTPVIHGQGEVDLAIKQEVSNASKTTTGVSDSPTISKRTLQTILSAPNGGTVVLGGLISQNQGVSSSGVPLLQDLPMVGKLFSNQSQDIRRTELLVLITPHMLSQPGELRSVTRALRSQFSSFAK